MLVNVRRMSEPKMVMGLTGPQAIKFIGDLCLEMLNTKGRSARSSWKTCEDCFYYYSQRNNVVVCLELSRCSLLFQPK